MSRADSSALWSRGSPECSEKRSGDPDSPGALNLGGHHVLVDLACETAQGILCRAVEDSSAVVKRDIRSFGKVLEDSKKKLTLCRLLERYEFEIVVSSEIYSSQNAQAVIEDNLDWLSEYEDQGGSAYEILRSVENDGPFHSTLSIRCEAVENSDNLPAKDKRPLNISTVTRNVVLAKNQLKNVLGYTGTKSLLDIRPISGAGLPAKSASSAVSTSLVSSGPRAVSPTDLKISAKCSVLLDDGVSNPLRTAYTNKKITDVNPSLLQQHSQAYVPDNRSVKTTKSYIRHRSSAAQPVFGNFWDPQQATRLYSVSRGTHDARLGRSGTSIKSSSSLLPDPPPNHRRTSMGTSSRHGPQVPPRSDHNSRHTAHSTLPAGAQTLKISPDSGMKIKMPKSASVSQRSEYSLPRIQSTDKMSRSRDTKHDFSKTSNLKSFSAVTLNQVKLPQRSGALPISPETSPDADTTRISSSATRRKIDDSVPGWIRRSIGASGNANLPGY